ncbi:MAG: GNAT family N-acetyltransferase [Acidimicrobiales bacterium]
MTGFDTGRLTARPLERSDAGWLAELHRDPDVMATIGGIRTDAESADWLATNLEHWDTHGYGQWVLTNRADGVIVGRGGLRTIDASVGETLVRDRLHLARSAWHQGYATETARAFVTIAFDHYDLAQLGAVTLDTNDASQHVLTKVGFSYERDIDHPVGPHRFYRLTRSP